MSLLSLYIRFLRIGAFTIGGGIVMMGIIESEMRAMGMFSDEQIADDIVMATAVPGPIATNLSYLAGRRIRGSLGAAVAVCGTVTAPFLAILFLSGILLRSMGTPWLTAFFLGACAGVVVVICRSLWNMIKNNVLVSWRECAAFLLTAGLILGAGAHPFVGLAAGAALSIVLSRFAR